MDFLELDLYIYINISMCNVDSVQTSRSNHGLGDRNVPSISLFLLFYTYFFPRFLVHGYCSFLKSDLSYCKILKLLQKIGVDRTTRAALFQPTSSGSDIYSCSGVILGESYIYILYFCIPPQDGCSIQTQGFFLLLLMKALFPGQVVCMMGEGKPCWPI